MHEKNITENAIGDNVIVINPGNVLDNSNAHQMVEAINKAQTGGYKFIIVDMGDLEFLASAGVGSILGTVEASRENGGDIILCNVPGTVKHVLEVLDLWEYFTIRTDTEEAISACG